MKKVYVIYVFIILILIGVFFYEYNRPTPVDWRPSLSSKSKEPFGQNLLINSLDELFDTVEVTPFDFYETAMQWEKGMPETFPLEPTERTKPYRAIIQELPLDSLYYTESIKPEVISGAASALQYEEQHYEEEEEQQNYSSEEKEEEEPERLAVVARAKNSAYAITTPFLGMDETDFFSLFSYVAEGRTVLIATEKFSNELALNFQLNAEVGKLSADAALNIDSLKSRNHELRVNPYYRDLFPKGKYLASKEITSTYFVLDPDCVADTVLVNQSGLPVLIAYACGKGKLYLCSTPLLFTNHELLYGDRDLLNSILVLLPKNKIYWDDFYKTHQRTFSNSYPSYKRGNGYRHSRGDNGRNRRIEEENNNERQGNAGTQDHDLYDQHPPEEEEQSILSFINSNASLSWAWYTLLAAIALYMISSARRRQKLIPVIGKLQNTTVEFVQMVSRLYYLKKDHKDIALKKINYFQEYLRSKYYHKDLTVEDKNIELLANRSNKNPEQIKRLFELIQEVQASDSISAVKLHVLSQRINEFKS